MDRKSIVEQIFLNADRTPQKAAIIINDKTYSYLDLKTGIISVSKAYQDIYDLHRGDTLILSAHKSFDFIANYFASHLLGCRTIPLAADTNPKRYDLICEKTSPSLILGFNDTQLITPSLSDSYTDKLSFPDMNDIADIVFTTGTTGEPKGVLLSHSNISATANNINSFIKNTPDDNEVIVLPLSHSFGLGRLRCALSNGQTIVLLNSFMMIKQFFDILEKYEINGFGMVPANWALIRKLSKDRLGQFAGQLHYIEIGSAPMPMEDKLLLNELLPNTPICMHYGLTEASRCAFIEFHNDKKHLDTVGKASPNTDIKIFDDNGKLCENDQEGEICVSGPGVTAGYLNYPDPASTHYGSYFRTGDWGSISSDGYIRLKSRKKELINIGGKKVSPIEIEDVLKEIEYIDDCACIAIPDPRGIMGEVVRAYLVSSQPDKLPPKEINSYLNGRLESYKIPAEYRFIDAIPRTASGKIQRLSLKND